MKRWVLHSSIFLMIFGLLFATVSSAIPCTAFALRDGRKIVVGKNLDWPVGEGFVVVNKRNISKTALVDSSDTPLKWISKYGSITFNQFGLEFPLGGMNEAGLVIEELSSPLSVYPPPDGRPVVNEFQWIQYHLDRHASVKELLESDEQIRVSRQWFDLHYLVYDRSGHVAVVEFLDGKYTAYTADDVPVEVLSNNTYAESIRYLKLHQGYGGGHPIRYGTGSTQRFLLAASLIDNYSAELLGQAVEYAFTILDSVRQHDTQWRIVYDIQRRMIHWKRKGRDQILHIDINRFNYNCAEPPQVFEIFSSLQMPVKEYSINSVFIPHTAELNRKLLRSVFGKLRESEGTEMFPLESFPDRLTVYLETLKCLSGIKEEKTKVRR